MPLIPSIHTIRPSSDRVRRNIPVLYPGAAWVALLFSGCENATHEPAGANSELSDVPLEVQSPWPEGKITYWEAKDIRGIPMSRSKGENGQPLFSRIPSNESGLDFVSTVEPDHPTGYLYRSGMAASGVALGDVDGDNRPDVFFSSGAGDNRLYRQLAGSGHVRFQDITDKVGPVKGIKKWASGVTMADVDNDGDLDIYVCYYDAPNELLINEGVGSNGAVQFSERAVELGVAVRDASHMPAFCDYDQDGDLDLFVLTNRYEDPMGYRGKEALARQPDGSRIVKNGVPVLKEEFKKYYKAWGENGEWGVRTYGREDFLLRNDGGVFVDVSEEAGIRGRGDGLSVVWWDANDDGWMDLYVANDFIATDRMYINQGDGTFRDVISERVPHSAWFSMGVDFGDINRDGFTDLLVADMSATNHFKQKTTMGVMGGAILKAANTSSPPQYMRNALYVGTGTERYYEAAFLAGLDSTDWTWTTRFLDLDNDGWEDVFVTNGTVRAMNDSDLSTSDMRTPGKHEWEYLKTLPPRKEKNLAFRNTGSLRFDEMSDQWGVGEVGISYAAASGDLDRDGDLDLLVVNVEEEASLLINNSQVNAITVRLEGTSSNFFGIGAQVVVTTASGEQRRQMVSSRGFLSADEPLIHFGLGDDDKVDKLKVRWPSGGEQSFSNLPANHYYHVTETSDPNQERGEPVPVRTQFTRSDLPFRKHVETEFNDFSLQPLLPNKLSQLGAGLAMADVDGDGDDDIYLGGGAGQIGELRLNQGGGKFTAQWVEAFRADKAHEDMGAVFFDADRDGDNDLYVVSGSYEHAKNSPELQDRLYLNDGKGAFTRSAKDALPEVRSSGSIVCAADFDRDGDIDLFVGGRVVSGEYPLAAESLLLRNEGGRFVNAAKEVSGLADAGLVTSALWSDADGDGWQDLLVTLEWGSVRLFLNKKGILENATEMSGLSARSGWWNSIAGGDIDGDGDIDYAVGNQGLNTKYHANEEHPVQIFYGDYDGTGKMNLVEAEFEEDVLYPIRGKSCSSNAMPHLREKFTSFRQFAAASLQEIYTPECLGEAHHFSVNTLESGVLINDGTGKFAWRPLSRLGQVAPVFGIEIAELNGDGLPDLIAAQNFYGPQEETGKYDGGMGQYFVNKGGGKFAPVWPRESGIIVEGDGGALLISDLNEDSAPDVLFGLNDDAPATFLNSNVHGNRFLEVRFAALEPGSKVTVHLEDGSKQSQELRCGGGYLSQHGSSLYFGLGKESEVDRIEVHWPSGVSSDHELERSASKMVINKP